MWKKKSPMGVSDPSEEFGRRSLYLKPRLEYMQMIEYTMNMKWLPGRVRV